ncbi:MAG: 2-hydroxychromene-2-carboxylate isomerase [SAR86 cluster bacterium]|jgi:2-hydroxychromene-2-carboxylate isomerase|uniref:2-hydroxychromene-2-carboxylate isomerase n=1 Tax=SAR86 cluster bacterium TaxID=2030880 RepID=A0A937JDR6_9GAMM|nr:2-hydroxychromene-2-carboxylate isomerase [SAR86 cluster bacterium]MDG1202291.1 2-hydroxychromene-2-carboxylate isomerase [SAR86 cluster bacterium]MDG1722137.1 2-hydroxychromene-2-carboxylate isomerase [SAR86 cluster bacterium]
MKMKVDFIFDFASPNAYFCHKVIPEIENRTGISFNYVPCLLGGIFKITNNQAPMMAFNGITNKLEYQNIEIQRFIQKHDLKNFTMNSFFPVMTLQLQRGAIAAKSLNVFDDYIEAIFKGMWEMSLNLADQEILIELLATETQIDIPNLIEKMQTQEIKDQLIQNTSSAVERGAFGIPTFFVDDEIFFGKDSLGDLEDFITK